MGDSTQLRIARIPSTNVTRRVEWRRIRPHSSMFLALFSSRFVFFPSSQQNKTPFLNEKCSLAFSQLNISCSSKKKTLFFSSPPVYCLGKNPPNQKSATFWRAANLEADLGPSLWSPLLQATSRPWRIIFKRALLPALMKRMPKALVA